MMVVKPAVKRNHDHHISGVSKNPSLNICVSSSKKQTVACVGCRKKKIKCSSDRPACSNCLRLNIPCEYPIVRNRGSRFGYKQSLLKRLQELKEFTSTALNSIDDNNTNDDATSREEQELAVAADDSMFPLLGLNEPVNSASLLFSEGEMFTDLNVKYDYPPMMLVIHLTELYFEHINNQTYSFLHQPSFMLKLERKEVSPLLVYAICALSARFSKHPDICGGYVETQRPPYLYGEKFFIKARNLLAREFDSPTLETVQATILMVQHEFFRAKGGKSLIYMAMAFPMALNLGLNKEPPSHLPWVEQEIRRRTFWSLVVLDRLGHTTPQCSLQLNENDFRDLALPCQAHRFINNIVTKCPSLNTPADLANSNKYDSRGVFAYHIEGTLLWNRANDFASKCSRSFKNGHLDIDMDEYYALVADIERFENSLPVVFQYSYSRLEELTAMRRMGHYIHVHFELQATKFMVYKNMCAPGKRSKSEISRNKMDGLCDQADGENIEEAEEEEEEEISPEIRKVREDATIKVIGAANKLSSMIQDIFKIGDNIPITPLVGYCIFIVSSVHIALSFSPDKKTAALAKQNLAINLKYLVDLRDYWYVVGVWCIILKDRYSQRLEQPAPKTVKERKKKHKKVTISEGSNEFIEDRDDAGVESGSNIADILSRPGTPPPYLPAEYLKVTHMPTLPPSPKQSSSEEVSSSSAGDSEDNTPHTEDIDLVSPLEHYLDDTQGLEWLLQIEASQEFVKFDYNSAAKPPVPTFNAQKEASILDHLLQTVMEQPVLH